MAEAKIEETMSVDKDKFWKAVTGYDGYPSFVNGCKRVSVDRSQPGRVRVKYEVSMMKDITYTLDHVEDAATGKMSWTLVESDFLKKNTGKWNIVAGGPGQTRVEYQIDIEFNFPVPGFVLSKLVKGNLPSMLKDFEKKAKTL